MLITCFVLYIVVDCSMITNLKQNKMKKLQQELKELKEALKCKSISVNEYSSFYYSISQKIKSFNK